MYIWLVLSQHCSLLYKVPFLSGKFHGFKVISPSLGRPLRHMASATAVAESGLIIHWPPCLWLWNRFTTPTCQWCYITPGLLAGSTSSLWSENSGVLSRACLCSRFTSVFHHSGTFALHYISPDVWQTPADRRPYALNPSLQPNRPRRLHV